MEYIGELANYGALGIGTIVLAFAVKKLYKRNCEYGDKVNDTVTKNTVAMEQHTDAIKGLIGVIDKCKK